MKNKIITHLKASPKLTIAYLVGIALFFVVEERGYRVMSIFDRNKPEPMEEKSYGSQHK
jgi:hypothetical protein